ncbi:hypothetical protein K0F64_12105 [Phocaeicola vulgatus]|nr:hypothetical protein [Phocaeicola vulgatus]MBU9914895.1 hypothetical protein [Phocaeicola vulgatus]MCE8835150.1 hypothetical protein [Phocaeicola vulgatus]MCE8932379.1 hypothetical protein [Phocaeicola vulgatus]MCE9180706.1 hypothetical protein [Phocaeicola vulgatus]
MTILVNGLPLVHVELKRRGVDIKEAFNQINRYNRESFWAGSGLFEYVQLFVVSNGTQTKYYSNTTRASHIAEASKRSHKQGKQQTSNSFEFTSFWASRDNKVIYKSCRYSSARTARMRSMASTSCSSSMNATAASSEICTPPSSRNSNAIIFSASREHLFSR